jgi:hypothetical protein
MDARRALPLAVLLSMGLMAQDVEPATAGIQARISLPEAGLKDVSAPIPGLGLSLVTEMDLGEGYRARLDMGADQWQKGDWESRPGIEGKVADFHLSLEGVLMLRPDETPSWGPYVLAGLGGYAWTVNEKNKSTGASESQRVLHVAGIVGMGFRCNRMLDVELKALAGRISPDLFAAAIQLGVLYRFNP